MDSRVAILIYKSMVLPFFDYADILIDKANGQGLDKLQRLQNRGLKLRLGYIKKNSTKQVHKEAQVPYLEDRRKANLLNFMFTRREKRPELLKNSETRTRAHGAPLFKIPFPHFEAFKRSVNYHGSSTWNILPPQLRSKKASHFFKWKKSQIMMLPLKRNLPNAPES